MSIDQSDINARISAAIRGYMTDHGVSHQQVADVLGRSRSYVTRRTSPSHDLSLDIVAAVAQITHISARAMMQELTERM